MDKVMDKRVHLDTSTMNWNGTLSPALSPSEGEREMVAVSRCTLDKVMDKVGRG